MSILELLRSYVHDSPAKEHNFAIRRARADSPIPPKWGVRVGGGFCPLLRSALAGRTSPVKWILHRVRSIGRCSYAIAVCRTDTQRARCSDRAGTRTDTGGRGGGGEGPSEGNFPKEIRRPPGKKSPRQKRSTEKKGPSPDIPPGSRAGPMISARIAVECSADGPSDREARRLDGERR